MNPPSVSVHSRVGGHRLAYFQTAHDTERAYLARFQPSQAQTTIAPNDPQANPSTLNPGNYLVIESETQEPWVGTIGAAVWTEDGIEISAVSPHEMLNARRMPQNLSYTGSIGSGAIFSQAIRLANRIEATGVLPPLVIPAGPAIVDFSMGGQTALGAIQELQERTNFEARFDVRVAPSRIQIDAAWGKEEGRDLSASVHLWQNVHFSELSYVLDLSNARTDVETLGGTSAVASRASGGTGFGQTTYSPITLERIRRAAPLYGRSRPRLERVVMDPTTESIPELTRLSRRNQERALSSAERWECAVNTLTDWRLLRRGNYITVHARNAIGGDLSRVVRLTGVQPSEEAGLCNLTLELSLR